MKLLVFKRNWADEFDVQGAKLMSDDRYALWLKAIDSVARETLGWHFGSNEGFLDETVHELMQSVTTTNINDEEAAILIKCFPRINNEFGWGNFPCFMEICTETKEVENYWEHFNR